MKRDQGSAVLEYLPLLTIEPRFEQRYAPSSASWHIAKSDFRQEVRPAIRLRPKDVVSSPVHVLEQRLEAFSSPRFETPNMANPTRCLVVVHLLAVAAILYIRV